ncbi:MAG TPA: hypothetical protein VNQ76_09320 [Planctomicrobium sp.]|nr:hypothetical protein [Planctomicrobium sp.]
MKDNIPVAESLDLSSQQHQRIQEYRADALKKKDPLIACIGGMNAQMMQISVQLGNAIISELAEDARIVEQFPFLEKPIDLYQRLTRQVERYTRVEQLEGSNDKISEFQHGRSEFQEEPELSKSENSTN